MAEQGQQLNSWKEIAAYLQRTVRTCQRLEASGLPVHRLDGSAKAHVFAYAKELDAWLAKKVEEERPPRRRRGLALAVVGAAAIVVAVVLIIVKVPRARRPGTVEGTEAAMRSVAVLPFRDLSPDQKWGYLAEGIAEEIHNVLEGIRGLRVCGRTSAFAAAGRNLEAREIGRLLSVQYIVEGTLQVVGERLRARARLIDAESGLEVWAEPHDRPLGDLFAIEDEIARSLAVPLSVAPLAGREAGTSRRSTADKEAYDLYLKGRYRLFRPQPESLQEALDYFEKARGRDKGFALAYAGIAWAYINMQTNFLKPPAEVFPKAKAAVEQALALDPGLAEAHALNAWVQFQYEWKWDEAEKSFLRALELRPGEPLTRGMHAIFLMSRRRFEEARAEIDLALATDPLTPVLYAYSMWIHVTSGRSDDVLEEFARFRRLEGDFEFAFTGAGLAYLCLGRYGEAETMFKEAAQRPHVPGAAEVGLLVCELKKGDRRAAEAIYGRLTQARQRSVPVSSVFLGWAAAALGLADQVFEWAETAIEERDPHIPFLDDYAETFTPEFARQPRFLALLDRIGLPHP